MMDFLGNLFITLLMLGIFGGTFVFIIYGIYVKTKEFLVVPIKKSAIFKKLIEKDGFEDLKKGSEGKEYLETRIKEQLEQLIYTKKLIIRNSVFKNDKYDIYISDIVLNGSNKVYWKGAYRNPKWDTRHICIYIDTPLKINGTMDIRKRGKDIEYIPFDKKYELDTNRFPDEFNKAYVLYAIPDVIEEILTPEVIELLQKQDLRYPFPKHLANELTGHFNRDLIISNKGILIISNPDGSRADIADALEFAKTLTSILENLTDSV